jgi:hypothetical protein
MRYLALPSILAIAIATGCETSAPTGVPLPAEAISAHRSAATCVNVGGTVTASLVDHPDHDVEGTLYDGDGNPIGTAYAWIDHLEPRGGGAIGIEMRHRYLIDGAALDTEDRGVLTPMAPPVFRFNNSLEVVGGTGVFEWASGFIRSHGLVDFGTGSIQLDYHGRVCT